MLNSEEIVRLQAESDEEYRRAPGTCGMMMIVMFVGGVVIAVSIASYCGYL